MYYEFSESVKNVASHRVLAMNRGEKEDFLKVSIKLEEDMIYSYLKEQIIKNPKYYCDSLINLLTENIPLEEKSEG